MRTAETHLTVIRAAAKAGVPVLIWDTPGTGKSETLATIARLEGKLIETVILSQREPADINGLPVVQDDGTAVLSPPAWARRLAEAENGGILFFDELSTAPPANQAAALEIIRTGRVADGQIQLADDIARIAAANPADVAAGGWDLAAPTANRFLHVDYFADFELWVDGMTVGFDQATEKRYGAALLAGDASDRARATAQVIGFLRSRPDHWNACPIDTSQAGGAWPSPRSWDNLAQVLAFIPEGDSAAMTAAARGLVGEPVGLEFMAWIDKGRLPDAAAVLDSEETVNYQDDDDRVFAVLGAVVSVAVSRGDVASWDKAWDVLTRAADEGRPDLAGPAVRSLYGSRPEGASWPSALQRFLPLLRDAGLLDDVAEPDQQADEEPDDHPDLDDDGPGGDGHEA